MSLPTVWGELTTLIKNYKQYVCIVVTYVGIYDLCNSLYEYTKVSDKEKEHYTYINGGNKTKNTRVNSSVSLLIIKLSPV